MYNVYIVHARFKHIPDTKAATKETQQAAEAFAHGLRLKGYDAVVRFEP